MSWERDMLLAIHGWSTPALDVVFLVSHELAGYWFCIALVVAATLVCWHFGERPAGRQPLRRRP